MHRRSRPGNPHLRPFPATLRLLVPGPRFENRGGRMAPQRPLRGAGSRCPQGHREVCQRRAVALGTPRCQASSAGWRRYGKARSAVLGAPTAAKVTATERAAGVRGARARGRDNGSPDPGRRRRGLPTALPACAAGRPGLGREAAPHPHGCPPASTRPAAAVPARARGNLDSARQKARDRRTLACPGKSGIGTAILGSRWMTCHLP